MTYSTKLRAELNMLLLRFEEESRKLYDYEQEFKEAKEHPWAEHWINQAKNLYLAQNEKVLAMNKKISDIEDRLKGLKPL